MEAARSTSRPRRSRRWVRVPVDDAEVTAEGLRM
jgi:hypothetical protein